MTHGALDRPAQFVRTDGTPRFTIPLAMEKKIFWGCFTVLGVAADLFLPLAWAIGVTIPILIFSWWVAYRSNWFGL